MSIQSDVEMLSIQALEYYARAHKLSEADTVHLFHKYQIFEKLILQHEYLHQLDFSETLNYIEEIIDEGTFILILYHGSNIAFDRIDLSKSHNRRDFGLFHQSESLKIKHFYALDAEWLEFIKNNRIKGGIQHSYDVVIGPVADDNTMETVQLYMSGILKSSEAVERLRYNKVNNQVSFHTPHALKHLKFEIRKEVLS